VGCPTNQSFGANVAVSGGLSGTSFTPAFVNACNAFGGFVNNFPFAQFNGTNNVSFNGWDLSGAAFYLNGANSASFQNCLIGPPTHWNTSTGYFSVLLGSCVGITVRNCTIDGGITTPNFVSFQIQLANFGVGAGFPCLYEYNWFKNTAGQYLAGFGNGDFASFTARYNFFDDTPIGLTTDTTVTTVANNGSGLFRVTT